MGIYEKVDTQSLTPVTSTLPAPRILTRRLELALITPDDASEYYQFLHRSGAAMAEFQPVWDADRWSDTLDAAKIDTVHMLFNAVQGRANFYAVRLQGYPTMLGRVEIRHPTNGPLGYLEIGYSFDPEFQRRGFAREATGAVAYAALTTTSCRGVLLSTDMTNRSSTRLAMAVGFSAAGVTSAVDDDIDRTRSGWVACYVLERDNVSVIRPEWRPSVNAEITQEL